MPRLDGRSLLGSWNFHFSDAGRRVERVDGAVRRREVHRVADHQRNGFVFAQAAGVAGGLEMKAPHLLQRRARSAA